MSVSHERSRNATPALVIHDAALLLVAIYAPIYWGSFSTGGQAMVAALVGAAAVSALVWRMMVGRTPSVIPNALHLPALALLALTALVTPFSLSMHGSLLELSRLTVGVVLLALVANRALLPASPVTPVAAIVGASVVVPPFVKIIGEEGITLDLLTGAVIAVIVARLLATRERPDPLRRWVEALLASAAMVAVYGVREKYLTYYVAQPRNPGWEIFSTFFVSNSLAGFLAMMLPIALALAVAGPRLRERALWGLAVLAMAAAMLFTNSKGGMLALFLALLVCVVLFAALSRRRRRNLALVLSAFALVVLAVAALGLASTSFRREAVAALGEQNHSNMFRLLTWKGTLGMIAAHPWVGIGPGAFKSVYMNYAIAGYTEAAHENYLQVAAEQGLFGLLIFLWLLGAALFTGWRALHRAGAEHADRLLAVGGLGAIIAFMLHSFFDYDWYIGAVNVGFWLVAGLFAQLAHGRTLPVPEAQPVAAPAKGKRKRLGTVVTFRLPAETGVHRLRWPARLAGQSAALAVVGVALLTAFWMPARNALAQSATSRGDEAMGLRNAAVQQQNTALAIQQQEVAIRSYREAVDWDPTWAAAHERYGAAASDPGEGIEQIQEACQLEPGNFQPYVSLGRLYELQKQWGRAIDAYEKALARNPGSTKTLRYLAGAYEELGDEAEALHAYQRLADLMDSPASKYPAIASDTDTNFAYAFYALGRAEELRSPQDRKRPHLEAALDLLSKAQVVVEAYLRPGTDTGRMMDQNLILTGQPRADRTQEMKSLYAKIFWRKADIYALLGNTQHASLVRQYLPQLAAEAGIDVGEEVAREDRGPAS